MKTLIEKLFDFVYRLFFTRDDDLDVLQVLFMAIIIVTLCSAWYIVVNTPADSVKIQALVTLRWIAGLLILSAVPKWLVPQMVTVLAGKKDPSESEPQPPEAPLPEQEPPVLPGA